MRSSGSLSFSDVTGGVSVTDARQFEDGTFYFILNKQRLFTIDRSTLDVKRSMVRTISCQSLVRVLARWSSTTLGMGMRC